MQTKSKRPYERPRLVPSDLFGADAAKGSCCRGASCTPGVRNTQRTKIDPSKGRPSVVS